MWRYMSRGGITKRDQPRIPVVIPISTSRRQMTLGRMRLTYGPFRVVYVDDSGIIRIFNLLRHMRVRYNPRPFNIVRESAETIVSITEGIKNTENICPEYVLSLYRVIVRFFQLAFKNRPTQYRSLRFVIINSTKSTCAYATYDHRYSFYYSKERVKIVFNLREHRRPIDVLSTIIHELAHVFAGFRNGHNIEFFRVFLAMVTVLKCSDLNLSPFRISQNDILSLRVSQSALKPRNFHNRV